ncbi:hypothetical protein [Streptomyces chiangmaiensis]|uniref:Uncharacterized protein n=1 Tax=Streptomyces chiangmaiensis TaxID=766497 RepID=A0ABU7FEW1_9ACTN|nr:hypothetical protein [Streptomyces chiangmaiensis]MED7822690.1 hypothetical protein [Streptomyces chiangmaiensis]
MQDDVRDPECPAVERDALIPLRADLDDVHESRRPGDRNGERPPARFIEDASTLVRLYTGRPPAGPSCELVGVGEEGLNLFG